MTAKAAVSFEISEVPYLVKSVARWISGRFYRIIGPSIPGKVWYNTNRHSPHQWRGAIMSIFQRRTAEATTDKIPGWKLSILIYMAVWTTCVLWFWLGMGGGGWIMAYTILSFGVLLPITTLVTAFSLEWKQDLGIWRWAAMGFFSIMYAAALWATFVLSTFLRVANIAPPSLYILLVGFCPSAIGTTLGWLVRSKRLNVKVPAIGLFLLLTVSYVKLKTLNGSFFRPVLILDIPVVIILSVMGLWILFKKAGKKG